MSNTSTCAEYSLAEQAILSQALLGTAAAPDLLSGPALTPAAPEYQYVTLRKIVIRRRGADVALDIQGSGALAQTFLKSLYAIANLLTLPSNWNSHLAKPISSAAAERTIRLLAEILEATTPPPDVVPTVRGGIQLEWHMRGVDIEVYVDSAKAVTFFAEDLEENGDTFEGGFAGHEQELRSWIHRISVE